MVVHYSFNKNNYLQDLSMVKTGFTEIKGSFYKKDRDEVFFNTGFKSLSEFLIIFLMAETSDD